MNTTAKGDQFAREIKDAAIAKGLDVVKVRASGHMGRRGGVPADLVIEGQRVEAKRYKGGIGSKQVEDILASDQGVTVVASRSDRGVPLIHIHLEDWLDLLAQANGKGEGK